MAANEPQAKAALRTTATASGANLTGAAAAPNLGAHGAAHAAHAEADDEDALRMHFRQVDRATGGRPTSGGAGGAGAGGVGGAAMGGAGTNPFGRAGPTMGLRANRSATTSRLWRTIPGGIHDVIEGHGENATTFSVEGIRPPTISNGSYIADPQQLLEPLVRSYMNRNLTWVDRLTPFRVLLLVLPAQPKEWAARHLYATQLLRAWYAGSRMIERTSLIVVSLDGLVEIVVGHQCRLVLSDGVARHFALKAMELARSHEADTPDQKRRMGDMVQKLVYYVSFTVRSRTQATAMSMRSMSMFMMMFMMMTIVATKQQQARRYAELYGMDPYARRALYGHQFGGAAMLSPGLHRGFGARRGLQDELFWDEFESGRRGGMVEQRERAQADAFFRLQILQMVLQQRHGGGYEYEDDEEEEDYEDEDVEEEFELLSAQEQAAFYEEERPDRAR